MKTVWTVLNYCVTGGANTGEPWERFSVDQSIKSGRNGSGTKHLVFVAGHPSKYRSRSLVLNQSTVPVLQPTLHLSSDIQQTAIVGPKLRINMLNQIIYKKTRMKYIHLFPKILTLISRALQQHQQTPVHNWLTDKITKCYPSIHWYLLIGWYIVYHGTLWLIG